MKYMQYKYLREKDLTDKKRLLRSLFHKYIGILYSTGMRSSGCLNLKWKDVYPNPLDNEEDRKERVLIKIHSEQSKTGRSREIFARVKRRLDTIQNIIKTWYHH